MGRDYPARTAADADWPAVAARLRAAGEEPAVRMIDGLPAFPDETPEPGWKELRLSFPAGMVTVRRVPGGYSCTVWGNADAALERSAEACARAFAGDAG